VVLNTTAISFTGSLSEVALPSVGKLEVPLDDHIPFIPVWGFFEQDLETVAGF